MRRTLYDLGARTSGAHFESNWVFDTPDIQLFESRRLLRLRSQEWPDAVRHVLTLKLPASQSGHFKVREERELEVADGAAMRAVLEGHVYALTDDLISRPGPRIAEGFAQVVDALADAGAYD